MTALCPSPLKKKIRENKENRQAFINEYMLLMDKIQQQEQQEQQKPAAGEVK